jgi:recombining binding protein (suppressor of hairless)
VNPWWRPDENGNLRPPTINISISGEHAVPASTPFWTTIQNKTYEETVKLRLTADQGPFLGKVSNKGLHISDGLDLKEDKKGRTIKATMVVSCRDQTGRPGREIGSFESKEIKLVSKPSKKRSSARAISVNSKDSAAKVILTIACPR